MTRGQRNRESRGLGNLHFSSIDGSHPFKKAVPGAYVEYAAHSRKGGKVFFFNFSLAREMGLISRSHPEKLNPALRRALLKTFSLEIINEYDILHNRKFPKNDIRKNKYMATRYLQVQHPSITGKTSGDGRGIWNGCFRGNGILWDITSSGTGATRLSPATAIQKKFFRTGDSSIPYGCGRADLIDGVSSAVMSEIFHLNGISTERILAIIAFQGGSSINVRAGQNLLRPAHFFRPLKQGNYKELKAVADYYAARQKANRAFPKQPDGAGKYAYLPELTAVYFARAFARFESDYIFCWLDWDGDNILMDGGIIDYGSVRQFGLYHHEYRYDDTEKFSTSIKEQRAKARYVVQTFAQLTDFLITGRKKPVAAFTRHHALKIFDDEFECTKDRMLLYGMGFSEPAIKKMVKSPKLRTRLRTFRDVFSYFERIKSSKGKYKTQDGITWDAIFCMRDILREYPRLVEQGKRSLSDEDFIGIIRSRYARNKDVRRTSYRRKMIRWFQRAYMSVIREASAATGKSFRAIVSEAARRSSVINRYERVTGDSIMYVSDKLIKAGKSVDPSVLHAMFREFVRAQILRPEYAGKSTGDMELTRSAEEKKILRQLLDLVKQNSHGL